MRAVRVDADLISITGRACFLLFCTLVPASHSAGGVAVAQELQRFSAQPGSKVPLQLRPRVSVGSPDGDDDAFGRIAYVALRTDGSLVVADSCLQFCQLRPHHRFRGHEFVAA